MSRQYMALQDELEKCRATQAEPATAGPVPSEHSFSKQELIYLLECCRRDPRSLASVAFLRGKISTMLEALAAPQAAQPVAPAEEPWRCGL